MGLAGSGLAGPGRVGSGRVRSGRAAHGDRPFRLIEYNGANTVPAEYFLHHEDEFVSVLEGTVVVDLDGDERTLRTLRTIESAYYPGGVDHRWRSADGDAFRLLVVTQGVRMPRPALR